MSGAPGERPAWVASVNRGEVAPITAIARRPFTAGSLIDAARTRMGVATGPADDGFVEPLAVLCAALETEAALTVLGRWITHRYLARLVAFRLQLDAYLNTDPDVRDEVIDRPVVVTGAPRTGTTLLHGLLATSPALRAPEGWELLYPLPPPEPASFATGARVALAGDELEIFQRVEPRLLTIHRYGARLAKECLSALSFSFRSEEFISRYSVPSYEQWLAANSIEPAYAMHRVVLQILQRRMPKTRWVLKSPVHLHALPTVFAHYPDATVVITHRDPLTVLASVTSLVATIRSVHSDTVDVDRLARYHAELYCSSLDRLATDIDAGTVPHERLVHVDYASLAADPGATLTTLSERLVIDPGPMSAGGGGGRGDGPGARHEYDFAALGLDAAAVRARVARYQARFGVAGEISTRGRSRRET